MIVLSMCLVGSDKTIDVVSPICGCSVIGHLRLLIHESFYYIFTYPHHLSSLCYINKYLIDVVEICERIVFAQ